MFVQCGVSLAGTRVVARLPCVMKRCHCKHASSRYMCAHSRARAPTGTSTNTRTHTHSRTHTHTLTRTHTHTHACKHANHMCTWHLFTVPDTFCYDVTLSESEIRVVARRPDVMKRGHCKHASSQHMCAHSRARARTCTSTTTRTHTHAHTHTQTHACKPHVYVTFVYDGRGLLLRRNT